MEGLIALFDQQFMRLHQNSLALIKDVPAEKLYWQPRVPSSGVAVYSCGEQTLRSAGIVEQTFGGITSNLWDDPFEWTLPESLADANRIAEYLAEVESTRKHGFELFESDDVLIKTIVVPSGETRRIDDVLLDTLVRAVHHQGRAFATFRLFSDARIPGI
jgi:hypothetical protein